MSKILIKISVVLVTFLAIMGSFNYTNAEEEKNLVYIVTGNETYFFNSTWDNQYHYNYSTGAATSESYINSDIGYIYGQRQVNESGSGQANGWIKHWVDWDCPVDNESGEINITYECGAYAFLGSNDSNYAYAKLVLTFFIDDEEHEVIIYNNTINGLNNTDEFSIDSIENWSKNLTLHNKTYTIGVNASFEIEFTGDTTESVAWLSVRGSDTTIEDGDGDTEYWAVLVGVDCNWCTDIMPILFDENVEDMCNMLLVSDHWQSDHIKVLTNEDATKVKIIDALCWLDDMDDGDDISVVYYTAHGSNFENYRLFPNSPFKWNIDLPPIDEEDGYDEYLTTYWTKINPFNIITDDLLNRLLGRLDSEGIAVIIDSCKSGGMIDNSSTWISKFSGEIDQSGRVMMTCCNESENGSGINFARYMMEGLQGYADTVIEGGNNDGVVSAEEAFNYAAPRYHQSTHSSCHPVISDNYDGELPLTDVDFPPSPPEWKDGPVVGIMNTPYSYYVSSIDPEDHNISYGWDWHEKNNILLDAEVDEWTSVCYPSNETGSMSHSWNEPGIYRTLVKSKDEYGAYGIFDKNCWAAQDWTTIITVEDEIVDQFQIEDWKSIEDLEEINNTVWHAQSFKPNLSAFSKIALKLKNRPKPVIFDVFIRDSLTGGNIAEVSKEVKDWSWGDSRWFEFVFPDEVQVTPNETYYIVVMCHYSLLFNGLGWASNQDSGGDEPDSYSRGEGWVSDDSGESWSCPYPNLDHCFVIYKIPDGNHPPDRPRCPSGPSTVRVNTTVEYSTDTVDQDGNLVYYLWDWDDGSDEEWDGFYSSGETVYANHTWTEQGSYSIRVKAKDIYGVESEWSPSLPIEVPFKVTIVASETCVVLGQSVAFKSCVSGASNPCSYLWTFGDQTTSTNSDPSHLYGDVGTYLVTLDVIDNNSDWSNATIEISVVILKTDFTTTPNGYACANETIYFNDDSAGYYTLNNWTWDFGDGHTSFDQNPMHSYTTDGVYNITLTITDTQSNNDTCYQTIIVDSISPEIASVSNIPDTVGFGGYVTISANISDFPTSNESGINSIRINITYPDDTFENCTMNHIINNIYEYVFFDTWLVGEYNYTIWAYDNSSNSNGSSGHSFNVSGQAIIDFETVKDSYGSNEYINITDLTNITVFCHEDDGHIEKSGTTYNAARNAPSGTVSASSSTMKIGQEYTGQGGKPYYIWRQFLFFNTSAIPSGVIIDSVTLQLYCQDDSSDTDFDIVIQNGQPTYPHKPLLAGDYDKDYYSGDGGSVSTLSKSTTGLYNIPLTNLSWVNMDGLTKLCLRSSRDINGNSPSGDEYISVWSANSMTTSYIPRLIVEYHNQPCIKNTGDTNISGYLLMQIQHYSLLDPPVWIIDNETINETNPRTINSSDQLALDLIFNGLVNVDNLTHGDGTYRVYAAFRDEYGDALICDDESALEAWYDFEVTSN